MTLHRPASQEGLDVFTPGRDLASILLASVRSQVLLGALSGGPAASLETLGALPGHAETLLEHCCVP